MTVELITGHAGSAHISAADDGWLNVGVVGSGKYVLDTGTQFACNVQSANLVTIGIGDALFEGRHVRVSATENVALDNGAQGVNRNDIICIKYEYDSGTAVESASLAVIKGTAVSGTPTDPTIPSGSILEGATAAYMPLWRIPISGITVGTPEKLYGEILASLDATLSRTWDVTQIPNLPAGKITSGTLAAARIPSLDASKVTSGTFADARIPSLAASKITSGTFADARIPNLNASKITAGTLPIARGGTGATTAAGALQNIMGGKAVLYNNSTGTDGTVSLSASAANYNHMRIYFKKNGESNACASTDVYSPNGKHVALVGANYDSGTVQVHFKIVSISGTSITKLKAGYFNAGDSSSSGTNEVNTYIYRVEAWNE